MHNGALSVTARTTSDAVGAQCVNVGFESHKKHDLNNNASFPLLNAHIINATIDLKVCREPSLQRELFRVVG